ncbi:T9SS type A sorting domain-containing protein [candidate division KSB1 bacterium]|nr:T9SS type A sorting domain-containing protein [candidate division KSB1 bacterium]
MKKIIISILLMAFTAGNTLAIDKIAEIQQAIKAKGASWQAGETWVSRLSYEERQKLYGADLTPPENPKLITLPPVDTLPASFDWREQPGNVVTPVKNQASCGSCWAFSATAQTESWWKKHYNLPDSTIDLSEQFLLSCSPGSCDGYGTHLALEFIKNVGLPKETCFRYRANDTIPCEDACDEWQDQAVTIPGWGFITLDEPVVENIKLALLYHPVSANYIVYEDFNSYTGGVYEHVWGEVEAGHAILIVGWNDEDQCWICKNSWGPGWGENGYFRIKWGDCGMGENMPFIYDEISGDNAFSVETQSVQLELTQGDSIVQDVVIKNKGQNILYYAAVDYHTGVYFHTSDFNAYDSLSWWCGDEDLKGYGDHWLQYMDTPVIDLSDTESPELSFMMYYAIENPKTAEDPYDGWDGCNVWISSDSGRTYRVIEPVAPSYTCTSLWAFGEPEQGWDMGPGIAGWAGKSNGWKNAQFDLSLYTNMSIILRFAFASDMAESAETDTTLIGFFVDDITVKDQNNVIYANNGDNNQGIKRYGYGLNPANWMTFNPGMGVIQPGDEYHLGLTINTRKMDPGRYNGLIRLLSSDTTTALVEIPIDITVNQPEHDLAVSSVQLPGSNLVVISSMDLGAEIKNIGKYTETNFTVICTAAKGTDTVYADSMKVASLDAGQTTTVSFKPFLSMSGGDVVFSVLLKQVHPDDYNSFNNTIRSLTSVTNMVDDFEITSKFWKYKDGWGVTGAHSTASGVFCAHVYAGITPYADNMNTTMTYIPGFELSSVERLLLSFNTRYSMDKNKDFMFIEISADSISWTKIDSLTGLSPKWTQYQLDLTPFIQEDMPRLWTRFHFISDEQKTSYGIFIDDVAIYPNLPLAVTDNRETVVRPTQWALGRNYPNPFNPATTIEYQVAQKCHIEIEIYDLLGHKVATLIDREQDTGQYQVEWNAKDHRGRTVPSGIYFYRMVTPNFTQTKKMTLLK